MQCIGVDNKTTISTKIFLPHPGKLELAYDERVWEADNKAEPDRADHILLCMHLLKMQSMFFAVHEIFHGLNFFSSNFKTPSSPLLVI